MRCGAFPHEARIVVGIQGDNYFPEALALLNVVSNPDPGATDVVFNYTLPPADSAYTVHCVGPTDEGGYMDVAGFGGNPDAPCDIEALGQSSGADVSAEVGSPSPPLLMRLPASCAPATPRARARPKNTNDPPTLPPRSVGLRLLWH